MTELAARLILGDEGIEFKRLMGAPLSRRTFLLGQVGVAATGLLACNPLAPQRAAKPTPAARSRAELPDLSSVRVPGPAPVVARDRTLLLTWGGQNGQYVDQDLWNPYAPDANHQNGCGVLYEPLAFYSVFADKEILWLASSYTYNTDWTELTIHLRPGVTWSDGVPFGADDVAFTLNVLKDLGASIVWGKDIQDVLSTATSVDPTTVLVTLKAPTPRFFDLLTYTFDIGVYIVPKHVFQNQDWSTFKHFDLARGWPVTTGPWRVTLSTADQKVLDRRERWWAKDTSLADMPAVERIVLRPYTNEQRLAEQLVSNQMDSAWGLNLTSFPTVFENPKIITHAGRKPPYGFVDWWPQGLYLNTTVRPFDDPDIRWALSLLVDRQQLITDAFAGAGSPSATPFPAYPPLQWLTEGIGDLLKTYRTADFNPSQAAALLQGKGWTKSPGGFWIDSQSRPLRIDIGGSREDIGMPIERLLRRQGIDVSYTHPPDADERFYQGNYVGHIEGHGGAVRDPLYTLRLYDSRRIGIPGKHQVNFGRWSNPTFDAVVDQISRTPVSERDKLLDLYRQAMGIWLPALPDIQLTEFYQRVPMNTTYWTGWPTADNAYVDGAFWHLTFPLILNTLQPAIAA